MCDRVLILQGVPNRGLLLGTVRCNVELATCYVDWTEVLFNLGRFRAGVSALQLIQLSIRRAPIMITALPVMMYLHNNPDVTIIGCVVYGGTLLGWVFVLPKKLSVHLKRGMKHGGIGYCVVVLSEAMSLVIYIYFRIYVYRHAMYRLIANPEFNQLATKNRWLYCVWFVLMISGLFVGMISIVHTMSRTGKTANLVWHPPMYFTDDEIERAIQVIDPDWNPLTDDLGWCAPRWSMVEFVGLIQAVDSSTLDAAGVASVVATGNILAGMEYGGAHISAACFMLHVRSEPNGNAAKLVHELTRPKQTKVKIS